MHSQNPKQYYQMLAESLPALEELDDEEVVDKECFFELKSRDSLRAAPAPLPFDQLSTVRRLAKAGIALELLEKVCGEEL